MATQDGSGLVLRTSKGLVNVAQDTSPSSNENGDLSAFRTGPAVTDQALTLASLLRAAAATHPSVIAYRLQAQAAEQDVTVAERQRWPTISVTAETDTGSLYSQPTRLLRVDQVLWDFGRALLHK